VIGRIGPGIGPPMGKQLIAIVEPSVASASGISRGQQRGSQIPIPMMDSSSVSRGKGKHPTPMISEAFEMLMPAVDSADAALDSAKGLNTRQHRVSSVNGHAIIGGRGSIGMTATVEAGAGEAKAAGKMPKREVTAARVTKAESAKSCILMLSDSRWGATLNMSETHTLYPNHSLRVKEI